VGLSADPGRAAQLGVKVSSTTIATMLRRYGLGPAPRHGPTWREFIRRQAAGVLACDFLTVETITLKTLYVLVWIELGRREVYLGGATSNPDSADDPASSEPGYGPPRGRAVPEVPDP
jgi:putative transposase